MVQMSLCESCPDIATSIQSQNLIHEILWKPNSFLNPCNFWYPHVQQGLVLLWEKRKYALAWIRTLTSKLPVSPVQEHLAVNEFIMMYTFLFCYCCISPFRRKHPLPAMHITQITQAVVDRYLGMPPELKFPHTAVSSNCVLWRFIARNARGNLIHKQNKAERNS